MKNILLILFSAITFFNGCEKSNEDKVSEMIQDKIEQSCLIFSYKPISTEIDSAFLNLDNISRIEEISMDLLKLLSTEKQLTSQLGYSIKKNQLDEIDSRLKKVREKIAKGVIDLKGYVANVYTKEQTSWIVYHKFMSEKNENSLKLYDEVVFLFDKDFTYCNNGMKITQFEGLLKFYEDISKAETQDQIIERLLDYYSTNEDIDFDLRFELFDNLIG